MRPAVACHGAGRDLRRHSERELSARTTAITPRITATIGIRNVSSASIPSTNEAVPRRDLLELATGEVWRSSGEALVRGDVVVAMTVLLLGRGQVDF
jgi:hypothetical protein